MNVSELARSLPQVKEKAVNALVVEHDAKHGNPPSITVIVYGLGVLVVTLELRESWVMRETKCNNLYRTIQWQLVAGEPTVEGAVSVISDIFDAVLAFDNVAIMRQQFA